MIVFSVARTVQLTLGEIVTPISGVSALTVADVGFHAALGVPLVTRRVADGCHTNT